MSDPLRGTNPADGSPRLGSSPVNPVAVLPPQGMSWKNRLGQDVVTTSHIGLLTGQELVRLMRQRKVTIRTLADRLGSTMKRVRKIRDIGLQDPLAVRDWIEAVTGEDPGPIPQSFRMRSHSESANCNFCGCRLYLGEIAYEYVGEVFCSVNCCRKSRNW